MAREKKSRKTKKSSGDVPKGFGKYALICGLILIAFAVLVWLSLCFAIRNLDDQIRNWISANYKNAMVDDVTVSPSGAIELKNLKICPEEERSEATWDGESLILIIKLLPILKGKIIPERIILDGFIFRFKRRADGSFVLPELIPRSANAQGGMVQLNSFSFVIKNSEVHYIENSNEIEKPIKLKLENLNANGRYKRSGNIVINNLSGEFEGARIKTKGECSVLPPFSSDFKIKIDDLNLSHFVNSFARIFQSDLALLPSGVGAFDLKLTGKLLEPEIKGTCNMKEVVLGNFHINDAHFDLEYANKLLSLANGIAKAYKGRINMTSEIDMREQIPSFTIDAEAKGIDLGEYVRGFGKEIDPPVSGSFDGTFGCNGDFYSVESLKGEGNLYCKGGIYLNPFKDVKPGMFSVRQDKYMEFIELTVNFNIADSKFDFDRIDMKSKWVDLKASGDFGFDWSADIEGTINASTELLKPSEGFKEISEFLTKKVNRVPVRFVLSGSLPNYSIHTALSEEAINSLLGDNDELRRRALELLRQYFGEETSDAISNSLPN